MNFLIVIFAFGLGKEKNREQSDFVYFLRSKIWRICNILKDAVESFNRILEDLFSFFLYWHTCRTLFLKKDLLHDNTCFINFSYMFYTCFIHLCKISILEKLLLHDKTNDKVLRFYHKSGNSQIKVIKVRKTIGKQQKRNNKLDWMINARGFWVNS